MDRVAVFVDAGYLFAQGSKVLSGGMLPLPRGRMTLKIDLGVRLLREFAEQVSGVPMLRIYWYDGTSTGPSSQHLAIAFTAGVKLRLGFVNSQGEQKGVDSLMVTDMIELARNRAMVDAVLLSGDEDLRVGVQQAQEYGVKVHLLGIEPSRGSQSQFLLQEADSTHEWGQAELGSFLTCSTETEGPATGPAPGVLAPEPNSPGAGAGFSEATVGGLVQAQLREFDSIRLRAALDGYDQDRRLPADIDRPLLGSAKRTLDRTLSSDERTALRRAFAEAARVHLAGR